MNRSAALPLGAQVTRPLDTGYHLRRAAQAALREPHGGASPGSITPLRRVIVARMRTAKGPGFGPVFVGNRRLEEGLPA